VDREEKLNLTPTTDKTKIKKDFQTKTIESSKGQGILQNVDPKLIHSELTQTIIGIYYDVYNELGHGFLENVYRNSMDVALQEAGLRVEMELPIPITFRGHAVGDYRADLLVNGLILIELKAVRVLEPAHEAQLHHYLRATPVEVGLLFNFGSKPEFKRLCYMNSTKKLRGRASTE